MPFKLIKGRYFVTGYSPDGDSIRFEADNTAFLNDLSGFRPKINQRNHVQLRIEAIDTLETHYQVKGGGRTTSRWNSPGRRQRRCSALWASPTCDGTLPGAPY
jgi:hypothetical protein